MHGGIVESPADETSKIYQSSSSVAGGKRPFFIYLATILSAIGGFLFGYDTGVVSGAMILLKDTFGLSSTWQEIIVSSTVAMAWLFSLLTGYMADYFGRKPVILLASVVFTAGAIMMGVAAGKYILLGGRLIVGAGIGIASMSVPVYIGEVAPADIRGLMVTLYQISIAFGMFVASILAGAFSTDLENGWRYMLGLAAVPSFFQFFGFAMMPESPRWLVSKRKYEQAVAGLRKLRGETANIELEFEAIKNNCLEVEKEQENSSGFVLFEVLKHPALRRALVLGCLLQTFQQICGINTVMYYSATIIQMAGFHDPSKAIWLSTATSGVNFVVGFVGMYLVEKIGRRPLFLGSMAGVGASLILLAIGFHITALKSPEITNLDPGAIRTRCYGLTSCEDCVLDVECGYCFNYTESRPYFGSCSPVNMDDTSRAISGACLVREIEEPLTWAYEWCPSDYSWIILLGLISYLFFFSPGMGPMPWAINTEIYPLWARGTCFSVSTSFNWLFNLVIAMTFLTLTETITKFGTFYLYTGLAALGWVIFYFMLPETKGKALEEVESLFANSWFVNRKGTAEPNKPTQSSIPSNTEIDPRLPISKSINEPPPAYGTINSNPHEERQLINGNQFSNDSEYTRM